MHTHKSNTIELFDNMERYTVVDETKENHLLIKLPEHKGKIEV